MKINQKRLAALKRHLLKVQKLTGEKLKQKDKNSFEMLCPMVNFSPEFDKFKNKFIHSTMKGSIVYQNPHTLSDVRYNNIFPKSASDWWCYLNYKKCTLYNEAINKWIANGCKEVK